MLETNTSSSVFEKARALVRDGRLQEALTQLDTLRTSQPSPDVYREIAEIFMQLNLPQAAQQVLMQGAQIFKDDVGLLEAIGNHFYKTDACAEGLRVLKGYRADETARPLQLVFANLLKGAGQTEEAEKLFQNILHGAPAHVPALSNLAGLYADEGENEKALTYYRRALEHSAQHPHIRAQLAQLLLRMGHFEEGFSHHAARFEEQGVERRPFTQKKWDGMDAQTLLFWGEQGIGEEILYVSLIPEVKEKAQRLLVECDARLVPLFSRSFSGVSFYARQNPPHTELQSQEISAQCAGGEAAAFLRRSFADFGKGKAYLKADAEKTNALRAKYTAVMKEKNLNGKIIGVSWRSKPLRQGDPKSTRLADWDSVFENSPHLFINLQFNADAVECAEAEKKNWALYNDTTINQAKSLDNFAAQIAACDGVITVSNTTAHMAGALGIQTCVLLPKTRGLMWHWFEERTTSPWYASLNLLRQKQNNNWLQIISSARSYFEK